MSIEKLEEIKKSFNERYNFIRTQEPLREIIYSLLDVQSFMIEVTNIFKDQSDQIADLRKQVAQVESPDKIADTLMTNNKHKALLNNCVSGDEAILHKREIEGVN